MKNRAKCKLCGDIIESYHDQDHVICKCGEIEVFAGLGMRCAARDFANFIRVDDEGNEIVVTYKQQDHADDVKPLYIIEQMIESYRRLPLSAMSQPVSNADLISVLEAIVEAFKAF